MHRLILLLAVAGVLAPAFLPLAARAQEVDCTVLVNYEAIATTNKEYLTNLANDIKDYVNNFKWGSDNLPDKIQCTINIFVQSVVGENRYSAQVFVGSQRKIFGTGRSSAVLRIFDEGWEFTYVANRPLAHNPYTFNDLTSFLDFYVYLVLGYDYDSYELLSGTPFLQKASEIASLGRSSGAKGWLPSTSGYSRGQFIDELLSPVFEPLRRASYAYHFTGLDSLSSNPDRAYQNILQSLESIARAWKRADPRSLVMKTFFDTKYQEIASVFDSYPDPSIYIRLGTIDPAHIKTYEEYRAKKNPQR